jgi:arylsulfatase A-like enzyme
VLVALRTFFLRPAVVGAIYVAALAVHALTRRPEGEGRDLGDNARAITQVVYGQFGGEIARIAIAIVCAALVIGAILGAVAGALVWAREKLAGTSMSPVRRAMAALGVTAVLHALMELRAMAATPQLYTDGFYVRGGLLRTVQVIMTDVLGPGGVVAIGVALALAFLAGPRATWKRWPSRVSSLVALVRRNAAFAGAVSGAVVLLTLVARAPLREAHADSAGAPASTPSTPPGAMNVIILAADSLRADRIKPAIAPALSALADRGTRFDRAYVSLPRTFPSWVSILSGRHPHHHGIRNMFPRWEERAKDFDALPARFAHAGYATAVVSDYAGDIFGRIELGFRDVDVPYFDFRQIVRQRALQRQTPLLPILHSRLGRAFFPVLRELNDAADASMLTRDAASAIHRLKDEPFFLTVFYSTAHFPYAAPAPYYARFTDPSYRGRYKYHRPVGLGRDAPPDARDIRQIQGLYDGAVASIDDAIAELLRTLDSERLTQRTIIVVTADHGETIFDDDHGVGHGDHLFGDEATHVPLVVLDPRRPQSRRVADIARDVDIAPTLYELAGIAAPSDLDGRSLVPAMDGRALAPALAYAETGLWFTEEIPALPASLRMPYGSVARITEIDARSEVVLQKQMKLLTLVAKHRMVRDDRYKLVYVPTRSRAIYMLYDTQEDPAETRDIAAAHPEIVARLKGELWTWMLKDVQMAERAGFLVPRDVAAITEVAEEGAIRIGDAKYADAPKGEGMP